MLPVIGAVINVGRTALTKIFSKISARGVLRVIGEGALWGAGFSAVEGVGRMILNDDIDKEHGSTDPAKSQQDLQDIMDTAKDVSDYSQVYLPSYQFCDKSVKSIVSNCNKAGFEQFLRDARSALSKIYDEDAWMLLRTDTNMQNKQALLEWTAVLNFCDEAARFYPSYNSEGGLTNFIRIRVIAISDLIDRHKDTISASLGCDSKDYQEGWSELMSAIRPTVNQGDQTNDPLLLSALTSLALSLNLLYVTIKQLN